MGHFLAAAWLALCPPAQAGQGAAREQFLGHRPDQRLIDPALLPRPLDQALLADLHGVQEGCAEPCVAPEEVAAYLGRLARACSGLGLSRGDLALALENYAPGGVPRRKVPSETRPGSVPAGAVSRLKPALILGRASEIAAALGQTPLLAAEGVPAAAMEAARPAAPPARPGPAAARFGAPIPKPGPMEPARVDEALGKALLSEITKRPAGRALLSSIPKTPAIVLAALEPEIFAQRSASWGVETIAIGTEKIADLLRALDPKASKWGALSEPAILRSYLAAKPAMIAEVARHADTFCVHELAHSVQRRRRGGGLLKDWIEGWAAIINRGKYPIEREWEAFGVQNLYFHEKAQSDLSLLRFNAPFTAPALQYASYIESLAGYRRHQAGLYQGDAARAARLRFHKAEAAYFKKSLAREDRDWPRVSVEGNLLLARIQIIQNYPTLSLPYIRTAHERTLQNGLPARLAAETREVFKTALGEIEAGLALAESGRKPWFLRGSDIALMERLGVSLDVPLPRRAAAAAKKK